MFSNLILIDSKLKVLKTFKQEELFKNELVKNV